MGCLTMYLLVIDFGTFRMRELCNGCFNCLIRICPNIDTYFQDSR